MKKFDQRQPEKAQLEKTLGLGGAVALALGTVLGAGMLALPGLIQIVSGDYAVWIWVFNGILVIPLLAVFAWLGRNYPGSSGIAGFVAAAYPFLKDSCSLLVIGTFALGFPGIALTGAAYLVQGVDLDVQAISPGVIALLAGGLMLIPLFGAWSGARKADSLQRWIISILLLFLCLVAGLGFWSLFGPDGLTTTATSGQSLLAIESGEWANIFMTSLWPGMTLAFFAYTGWEMMAFTSGEFKNPRRDFPLSILLSFFLVLALYCGIALAVAQVPSAELMASPETSLLNVIERTLVFPGVGILTAILVIMIIIVNLNAAIWAASRLTWSFAHDLTSRGLIPLRRGLGRLGLDRLSGTPPTPRPAILFIAGVFSLVLMAYGIGWVQIDTLLSLAGQNFFVLYLFTILAFIKLVKARTLKIAGVGVLALSFAFIAGWGLGLIYAAVLCLLPLLLQVPTRFLPARKPNPSQMTEAPMPATYPKEQAIETIKSLRESALGGQYSKKQLKTIMEKLDTLEKQAASPSQPVNATSLST